MALYPAVEISSYSSTQLNYWCTFAVTPNRKATRAETTLATTIPVISIVILMFDSLPTRVDVAQC